MNTTFKTLVTVICFSYLTPLSALAVDAHHKPAALAIADGSDMTAGEVRKVDTEAGKVKLVLRRAGRSVAPCALVADVGVVLLRIGWRLAAVTGMALLRAASERP